MSAMRFAAERKTLSESDGRTDGGIGAAFSRPISPTLWSVGCSLFRCRAIPDESLLEKIYLSDAQSMHNLIMSSLFSQILTRNDVTTMWAQYVREPRSASPLSLSLRSLSSLSSAFPPEQLSFFAAQSAVSPSCRPASLSVCLFRPLWLSCRLQKR